jgi:hypothetical protein
MFDLNAEDWWLTTEGGYQTAAAETMRRDGSGFQQVIILEWPARLNKTHEEKVLRLMVSPEDADGLAEVLRHTARWMKSARALGFD